MDIEQKRERARASAKKAYYKDPARTERNRKRKYLRNRQYYLDYGRNRTASMNTLLGRGLSKHSTPSIPTELPTDGKHTRATIKRYVNRTKAHFTKARGWYHEYKRTHPCTDCQKQYMPAVMEFDHLDPATKSAHIAVMVSKRLPKEAVLAEIALCEIVCANCHRIRTHNRTHIEGEVACPTC